MSAPALVAVAHGSRDPRSAATIDALAAEVRSLRPDLDVRVSFLDLSAPRLADVLDGVAADGHRHAVVVPLLLGTRSTPVPTSPQWSSAAAGRNPRLRIDTADVLGGDPGTDAAALSRLRDALVADGSPPSQGPHDLRGPAVPCADPLHDPELGVVLASVGSTRAVANRAVAERVSGGAHGSAGRR